MLAFGPVPSRRLGASLGINNIPPKICSYSCIYCQLGATRTMRYRPLAFHPPEEIYQQVANKVERASEVGETIDYLTFVADGEPTLDAQLGKSIELLKPLGIKIAVISNGSLIDFPLVRDNLSGADWVSLKVDAVDERTWRKIDRPHGRLRLSSILEAMLDFSKSYRQELVTETMLVRGINDRSDQIDILTEFLSVLQPHKAYLAIPTRPPAEPWVQAPEEKTLNQAYQIVNSRIAQVEYLIGYEGNAFASTGNLEDDLLSITAVHPMRSDAVNELLSRSGSDWLVVQSLVERRRLIEIEYHGENFIMRKL